MVKTMMNSLPTLSSLILVCLLRLKLRDEVYTRRHHCSSGIVDRLFRRAHNRPASPGILSRVVQTLAQPCCSSPFAPACPSHKVLIHCPSRVAHLSGGNNCARSRAFREVGIRAVRPEAFLLESKSQPRSRVSPCPGKSRGKEQRVAAKGY